MDDRFEELLSRVGEISDLNKSVELLAWDEETKMPVAGAAVRAEQRATLSRLAHEKLVAEELGALLEELRPFEEAHEHDSFEASLIRVTRRDRDKAVSVPPDLHAAISRQQSLGYRAWLAAREAQDFRLFLPSLERALELVHEYVACFSPEGDPYDVLLDDYEPGMKTAEVEPVFDRLKAELVPLIAAAAADDVDDSCLHGRFSAEAQRRFSLAVLERWGMDAESWRLDDTVHPFASSLSPSDIRLTTNFREDGVAGILSCLHEFGHGLYERQVDPRFARTPLGHGVSSAFHESQSRMWENLVGRSLSTWRFFYPELQAALPEQFADVPLEVFHRALNKVEPSLRRVDSDEVTYCLHIILRFELERALLAGDVTPAELPEAFDAKMRDYLGLQPPTPREGVLQDVHWSELLFGYFPTYALGNVVSVQLWERAEADLGDLDALFERGEFTPLREWLRDHVHRYGRSLTPQELLVRAAGGPLDPEPYLAYLRRKLGQVYGATVGG
ncbi:MAG TPA: carboxypeptidase M32 [Gaiellaceae bacterium]|nr:carboxypeptidase M32 [Gaiellaceae bacterium]